MKTIEEHNREVCQRYSDTKNFPCRTGVKCPHCMVETELIKFDPGMLLLSSPPQSRVYCPSCGYITSIYWTHMMEHDIHITSSAETRYIVQ